MTWFRVDDDLAFHRKTVAAGNAAMGLWVRAGSWCSQQLSDGRIPYEVARTMGTPSEIKALIRVGLWVENEGFLEFFDFFSRNPSRAEVMERRAAEARKKADWRAKRAGQRNVSTGDTPGESPGESLGESLGESRSSRPDPTPKELTTSPRTAPRPEVRELCEHLHTKITENGSKATITQKWLDSARLMIDRDGRDLAEAHRLIDWCQADDFWHKNILSMPTFREQYDRLRLKAFSTNGHGNPRAAVSARQHTFADGTPMPWDR